MPDHMPKSEFFTLQQLSPGIFAAIEAENGLAGSNAGIIDLGDRTVVFDSFVILQPAEDLCRAAVALTGRQPDYLINSHWHGDHVMGNQAFPAHTRIISTGPTRTLIEQTICKGLPARKEKISAELAALLDKVVTAAPEEKAAIQKDIVRCELADETYRKFELRLPDITVESDLILYGSQRSAILSVYSEAHTATDLTLFLPQDGILFMGDLLFSAMHPWMGSGKPAGWLDALEAIQKLEAGCYVPGHGPISTMDEILRLKDYIYTITAVAEEVSEAGGTVEDALKKGLPERFLNLRWSEGYEWNLQSLFELLKH